MIIMINLNKTFQIKRWISSIFLLFYVFITSFLNAQEIPKHNIYFGNDSYELTPSVQQLLDTIYLNLPDGRSVNIGIVGDLSKGNSTELNNQISEKRLKTATDYLIDKGVKSKDIITSIIDRNNVKMPAIHDKTKELFNYEILLKKAPAKGKMVYWYKKLNQEYPKKPNCFIINPMKTSNLTSYEGTIISIPQYSFVYETGELAENEINICFLEFYKKSDMLLEDLNTMFNGKAMQTGGLINISATCNNRTVVLSSESVIKVKFPTKQFVPGMKLYTGIERTGLVVWQESDVINSSASQNYYMVKITKASWESCATTIDGPNTGSLTVTVDSAYKQDVRLVLKSMNSVITGEYINDRTVAFKNLPLGQHAYIISYCYRSDVPAFSAKEITISSSGKETLELQETTYKDLQTFLNSLQ